MFKSLADKINYEYKNFYIMVINTSKQNIFASSDEITWKKLIKQTLSAPGLFPEEEEKNLMGRKYLLDEIYSMAESEGDSMGIERESVMALINRIKYAPT